METKTSSKKNIIIVAIAAVVVIVLGFLCFRSITAPKRTAKNYIKAAINMEAKPTDSKNYKKVLEMTSQLDVGNNYDVSSKSDIKDQVEDYEDMLEDADLDDQDIKVKKIDIKKCEKFDKDLLEDFKDYVDDKDYDYIEGKDIKKAYYVKAKVEVKGDDVDDDNDSETMECTVIKEKGKWRVSIRNWKEIIKNNKK